MRRIHFHRLRNVHRMEGIHLREKSKKGKKRVLIIGAVALALVLCLVSAALVYMYHTPATILPGVKVCGVDVGGMTREEAVNALTDAFGSTLSGQHVVYEYQGHKIEIPVEELSPEFLVAETVQKADEFGKSGGPFRRWSEKNRAKNGEVDLPLIFSLDDTASKNALHDLTSYMENPAVPNDDYLDVETSSIVITNGTQGNVFDTDEANKELHERFGYLDFSPIELCVIAQKTTYFTADDLQRKYPKEPQDATYEIVGYAVAYTEGVPGVEVDRESVDEVLEAHRQEGEQFSVPVTLIMPNVTVDTLEQELFGARLSTYTTRFNTGDVGRSKNVALAAEKINGTVLVDGAEFSYNEIVGERTIEQGFQIAKVYSGGQAVDGVGGGICQVSTTLYNAVLYANLEVVSRRNHQLPVHYVPLGQDATVVYGQTDFKFRNNSGHPVKIVASTNQGELTVSIYGTQPEKKTEVTITNQTVATIPYAREEVKDSSLPYGQTKKQKSGSNGYRVDTYIKVTEDGVVVRDELLSTSTYNPQKEIVAISSQTAPPTPAEPAQPLQSSPPASETTPAPVSTPTGAPAEPDASGEE